MSERDDWLALTREQVIEPGLPICDPHHHLWNHPGSRYLVEEFLADIDGGKAGAACAGHRVTSTVFVECLQFYRPDGPEEMKPVGETEFIDGVAGDYETSNGTVDVAAAIVGFADLTLGREVQAVLEAHLAASKRFCGIRYATAWDASERIHNAHTQPRPGLMQDAKFRAGLACLEPLGLSFDAWLYHPQLAELVELAQDFPGLTIVLDHMAGPLGIGPYAEKREAVFDAWRHALEPLARCANVNIKLGGRSLTMAGFGWHRREAPPGSSELAEAFGPYYRACIDLFGAERCMFESNFPVDRASCSYTVLWNAFKKLSANYSPQQRAALFHDTASRVYRLNGR